MSWAYRLEGPMQFVRHVVEPPTASDLVDGEVLLRFRVGGICGSDLPRCRDDVLTDEPAPFGRSLHEIVGDVVASRADLPPGERVVGWVASSNGLREFVPTAANELLAAPDELSDTDAVALQPLACVLHAAGRLSEDLRGTDVTVIGLGPIGLLFAHVMATRGATVTGIDVVDRSDVAAWYGLSEVHRVTSRTWARRPAARGADVVVEAVGHQTGTLDDAVAIAGSGATIVYFGNPDDAYYPLNLGAMMDKALTLQCGRTPSPARRDALQAAITYAHEHPKILEGYVTDVLPVEEAAEAYRLASRPATGQRKIVLQAGG